jgi:ankyrin repeat protein
LFFLVFLMGVTPLIIAVRKGYNALVSDLLRGGADPGKLDLIGQSAVDYANAKTRAILNFEAYVEKQPTGDNEEEEDAKDED